VFEALILGLSPYFRFFYVIKEKKAQRDSRIHVGGYDGPTMLITPGFPHEKKSL
jgi:hypothetical protein